MTDIVADTHAAIWYFSNSPELSRTAKKTFEETIANGFAVILSTISIVEMVYLTEKGRLDPKALPGLIHELDDPASGFISQNLTPAIAEDTNQIPRSAVPDMPDRIIAATALHLNLALVTKDKNIQSVQSVQTIW